MLVLSRKPTQQILIFIPGRERPVIVELAQIRGPCSASIGIEAETDLRIIRKEIYVEETTNAMRRQGKPLTFDRKPV